MAQIRPLKLMLTRVVDACVYSSRATHVSEAALCAASVKIRAYAAFE